MRSNGSKAVLGCGAVVGAVVGVAGVGVADAAPATQLCTINYPIPNAFSVQASSVASASSANGFVDLTLHTNAKSYLGYEQTFRVSWANIDTGFSGYENVVARVSGPDTVLSIPHIETKSGHVYFVLGVTNHGIAQTYTNGDCTVDYTAN
ncbi:hypothetical protein [Antrihabitans cavernicola]|uniref:Uncharacterized protein n=1 Tax=Antrihabitans cavernicola TaxID=2495913 RepID=A0A5A7S510_9NOCA|nr:hypothetical protein [Spelaeibacter cavernicola]KAA0018537.1 hypothetical protein FOY51_23970 [Spelaeibacter cavernicola]